MVFKINVKKSVEFSLWVQVTTGDDTTQRGSSKKKKLGTTNTGYKFKIFTPTLLTDRFLLKHTSRKVIFCKKKFTLKLTFLPMCHNEISVQGTRE